MAHWQLAFDADKSRSSFSNLEIIKRLGDEPNMAGWQQREPFFPMASNGNSQNDHEKQRLFHSTTHLNAISDWNGEIRIELNGDFDEKFERLRISISGNEKFDPLPFLRSIYTQLECNATDVETGREVNVNTLTREYWKEFCNNTSIYHGGCISHFASVEVLEQELFSMFEFPNENAIHDVVLEENKGKKASRRISALVFKLFEEEITGQLALAVTLAEHKWFCIINKYSSERDFKHYHSFGDHYRYPIKNRAIFPFEQLTDCLVVGQKYLEGANLTDYFELQKYDDVFGDLEDDC